jgi:hypothetical protein
MARAIRKGEWLVRSPAVIFAKGDFRPGAALEES